MCNFWESHNHIALNKKKLKNEAKIESKLLWLKHTPFEIFPTLHIKQVVLKELSSSKV